MHYDLPDVTEVLTEHGGHIEPALEQGWSDGRKLAWLAATVKMETGLNITVKDGCLSEKVDGEWVKVPNLFSFTVGVANIGSFTYREAWVYLTGVGTGARQAIRTSRSSDL
ncbi:hypothetical protein ABZ234_03675 [Nocardiopsis sp. NPDC006198]|uniref:hypothetical protein n=1 Tax=Nocardiopsis sp. NPDC006198 TaxID=3154472 RepID=UPI0033AB57A8